MLTFEQALLMLKSGEDMRIALWPRQSFVRATTSGGRPVLVRYDGKVRSAYVPTDAEIFSSQWSKA